MASPADLATLRVCERADCEFKVLNGVTDLKDILMAMANHLAAIHPASGGSEGGGGGGGAKSNAPIPPLDEDITEVQWSAWKSRFERWQLSCKISDKAVENRIFEAIPNTLADQICVGLLGTESKADLLAKIKDTVVKNAVSFCIAKIYTRLSKIEQKPQNGTRQGYGRLRRRAASKQTTSLRTIRPT